MIEINYPVSQFAKDTRDTFGAFLVPYGFQIESEDLSNYEITYASNKWKIMITMLTYFPVVSVSTHFLSSENELAQHSVLTRWLGVNMSEIDNIRHQYLSTDQSSITEAEKHRLQMQVSVAVLERFYRPLLSGAVDYHDYERFASGTSS